MGRGHEVEHFYLAVLPFRRFAGATSCLPFTSSPHRLSIKMLYLVGLGLADETDITFKGLEIVKRSDRVYLEAYTSILLVDKEKLVCGRYRH